MFASTLFWKCWKKKRHPHGFDCLDESVSQETIRKGSRPIKRVMPPKPPPPQCGSPIRTSVNDKSEPPSLGWANTQFRITCTQFRITCTNRFRYRVSVCIGMISFVAFARTCERKPHHTTHQMPRSGDISPSAPATTPPSSPPATERQSDQTINHHKAVELPSDGLVEYREAKRIYKFKDA